MQEITAPGVLVGALVSLATLVVSHYLSGQRASEERKEAFRLRIYELRIQAAQSAYQYVFKVYRERQKFWQISGRDPFSLKEQERLIEKLLKEAREWLDGQALILGDEVYQTVYVYFNSVGTKEENEALVEAQEALKKIVKRDLIEDEKESSSLSIFAFPKRKV